ncbi:bifunctional precorrin-2 dehydrogenase/sirohydrochlorin ferrochelatase [Thermodesulfobacteriota bacterium]
MSYYPILVDLEGQRVTVIGGGTVAQRKIETLLECSAVVHLISRELTPTLQRYIEEGRIKLISSELQENDLQDVFLVIAATDDSSLNRRISEMAKKRGILVNVVDQPSDCNFIVPSVIKRGDLLIAISTSGKSPALAKRIKEKLTGQFGSEYESFLLLMGRLRKKILSKGLSQDENRRIFHELVDSPILESIIRKDWGEIAKSLSRILQVKISPDDVIDYLKAK